MLRYVALLILLFGCKDSFCQQKFKGSGLFGLTMSQIDGDDLYGYNKLGITAGFKVGYFMTKKTTLSIEMLYSERGSRAGFGFGSSQADVTVLRYISMPLIFTLKDWKNEKGNYYRVAAHFGLDIGFLFDVSSVHRDLYNNIDNYNRTDVGYVVGIGYKFSKLFGLTLRYTKSFTSLTDAGEVSHFITIRSDYSF